jgi:Cof subfamily protein (haloacid dehalogenase superfamily)
VAARRLTAPGRAIRLILVDVDGTLVGRDGVHASTWEAVARVHARGVHIGLCTGRIGSGKALEYARRVSPAGFHIFQNGAVVSRPGEPAGYTSVLPPGSFRALVAMSRQEREPLEAYSERRFFLERHNALTRVHETHLEMTAEIVDLDALPEPALRAQWVIERERWPRFRELTLALGDVEVNPATAPWSPGTVFSNVTRTGTSKVSAVRWLAAHLGIGVDSVAMIGDAVNDLETMQAVGLAIAMGNSEAPVKAQAAAVVAEVDAGGLAEAIDAALVEAAPPHVVPIEAALDLHSFRPRDVPDVVRDYLEQAVALGMREVRLIHGRGIGVQRERVRALLAAHADVESFADATADRGHWGATVVTLRTSPAGP